MQKRFELPRLLGLGFTNFSILTWGLLKYIYIYIMWKILQSPSITSHLGCQLVLGGSHFNVSDICVFSRVFFSQVRTKTTPAVPCNGNAIEQKKPPEIRIWVCLKMGYTPNYSHLVGINDH